MDFNSHVWNLTEAVSPSSGQILQRDFNHFYTHAVKRVILRSPARPRVMEFFICLEWAQPPVARPSSAGPAGLISSSCHLRPAYGPFQHGFLAWFPGRLVWGPCPAGSRCLWPQPVRFWIPPSPAPGPARSGSAVWSQLPGTAAAPGRPHATSSAQGLPGLLKYQLKGKDCRAANSQEGALGGRGVLMGTGNRPGDASRA